MVAWFEEEGLVSDSAPVVAAQENAGNPHYLPTARAHAADRPDELVLLDLWGRSWTTPARSTPTLPGSGSRAGTVPAEMARGVRGDRRARDAAVGAGAGRGPAAGANCAAGRSTGRRGRCSSRPDSGNGSCIAPATVSGETCTATACTWTITRRTTSGGCCQAPDSPSNLGCISNLRRANGNQHVLRRARRARDRAPPDGDRDA